jgi:hypothetical protein
MPAGTKLNLLLAGAGKWDRSDAASSSRLTYTYRVLSVPMRYC